VVNAVNRGASAVIIYNNTPEDEFFTLGEELAGGPVAISIGQADGQYLVANKLGQSATIVSDIQWEVSGYEAWNGTSMATPHVSGVAALVWSANPSWTNAEIRDALDATAEDLGAAGRDVAYGYGLVQAKAALDYLGGGTPPPPEDGVITATVSTDKSTYSDRETVRITVSAVDEEGVAVSNANVSVSITTPRGTTTTLSGVTGTTGAVTLTYRVSVRKYGSGTYNVSTVVSKTGYTDGTASTTFLVQ